MAGKGLIAMAGFGLGELLPDRIDIREVGMRDGLQLEDPVSLADKLRMLAAIVATGVQRIEVTSGMTRVSL